MNPTCPAGTSEDSFVVDFSSAFESPVSSLESKLTPTINGLLRAVIQERAIMEDAHRKIKVKITRHVRTMAMSKRVTLFVIFS